MSKSKDKRIKKLKRKHIWPSVLGLFFIIFIFFVILSAVLGFAMVDVVQGEFDSGVKYAKQIAALYEGFDPADSASSEVLYQSVITYLQLSPDTEEVVVLDRNDNKIWASGTSVPDMKNAEVYGFFQAEEESNIRMIVKEDKYRILTVDEGGINVSDSFIEHVDAGEIIREAFLTGEEDGTEVLGFKIWYVVPVGTYNICVLQGSSVYAQDFLMFAVSTVLFTFLVIVFVLYYIISLIGILANMHKTTKIIYTDLITGGNNWLYFVKRGTVILKKNRKGKRKYAMLHLKMHKYRSFCTCFGVREAENLVEKFYHILEGQTTRKEVIALHEKAEFGLLLTYTDVQQLTERILAMEKKLNEALPNMKLNFSCGIYLTEGKEHDVDRAYNNALLAREMSGEDAENNIAFYNIEMNKQRLWERKVEDDMDRALANKEFKVYLQPKISTAEEKLAGAEALVRWIHPEEGFIPPNKFIPIFEQNGFILKLDDYMLEEISAKQAEWIAAGKEIVPISVNISRAHFTKEDLAEHIVGIVDKYHVPHSAIELELTESAFFDDKDTLLNTVKKLREAGFPVSMDDFGAGYSSLNSLKELHLDVLKIDADFFRGVGEAERGMLIVSEVIDLAKKLNMKIVAEGIESREQVDFLTEQECDLIQGYFYAKPMPVEEFEKKYSNS